MNYHAMLMLLGLCSTTVTLSVLPRPIEIKKRQIQIKEASTSLERFYMALSVDKNYVYPPNYIGKWTISKTSPSVCKISLLFERFNVESSKNCVKDFMEVTIGSSTVESYCGMKSGQTVTYEWPKNVQKMTIEFITDNMKQGNGISILATQQLNTCENIVSYKQFYMETTNFRTNQNYPNDILQEWFVARNSSDVCKLELQVADFKLQAPTNGICLNDQLVLQSNRQIQFKCGTVVRGIKWSLDWPTDQEQLPIKFVTDSSVGAKGFSILVTQQKCLK
ncbi:Uncharacterised protein g9450 [Pycnogonum litorale]